MKYRSAFEERLAQQLEEAGVEFEYEKYTYTFDVPVGQRLVCDECGGNSIVREKRYTPDFFLPNGMVIEAKGKLLAEHRRVFEAFKLAFPEEDFRLIFMRDNLLRKRGKHRYSDWARSAGIRYSIGRIDPEWLE